MADYNVNMKQWNGTSFDNVLPLAYNSNLLNGSSLFDIQQYVKNNGLLLFTGTYLGNGSDSMKSVTFPFIPKIFIFPQAVNMSTSGNTSCVPITTNILSTEPATFYVDLSYSRPYKISIWKSNNEKTIYWEPVDGSVLPFNVSGLTYGFAAIGGLDYRGRLDYIIENAGDFVVPYTGRYTLELYGGGGGSSETNVRVGQMTQTIRYTGSSSCQHYESINLTKGETINVTIGEAGKSSATLSSATDGGSTTFGQYSVEGGKKPLSTGNGMPPASGNYGRAGVSYTGDYYSGELNTSLGVYGSKYGVGSSSFIKTTSPYRATKGAVYLRYLGE